MAVLIALLDLADHAEAGVADGTLSALDKLSRVMPPRLRSTVQALSAHTSSLDLGQVAGAATTPSTSTPLSSSLAPAVSSAAEA